MLMYPINATGEKILSRLLVPYLAIGTNSDRVEFVGLKHESASAAPLHFDAPFSHGEESNKTRQLASACNLKES
jgi:hypothetical protein